MKLRYVALVVLLVALFPTQMGDLCVGLATAVIDVAGQAIGGGTADA